MSERGRREKEWNEREWRYQNIPSMASSADRPREKEIFGIFGFINTIKITNGKFSEVASVVLTIEIERLLYTHTSQSWKQLFLVFKGFFLYVLLRVKQ